MSKKGWIILIIIIGVIWYMNSGNAGKKKQELVVTKNAYETMIENNQKNSSSNAESSISNKYTTPVFTVPPMSCSSCTASGRCKYCTGTGLDDFETRMKGRNVRCKFCSGSGRCSMCKGDGIVNK